MASGGAEKVWIVFRYDSSSEHPDVVGVWAGEFQARGAAIDEEANGFETEVEEYEVRRG